MFRKGWADVGVGRGLVTVTALVPSLVAIVRAIVQLVSVLVGVPQLSHDMVTGGQVLAAAMGARPAAPITGMLHAAPEAT